MAGPAVQEPEIESSKFASLFGLIFALLVLAGIGAATAVSADNIKDADHSEGADNDEGDEHE